MDQLVPALISLALLVSIVFALWRFVWAHEKLANHLEAIAKSLEQRNP